MNTNLEALLVARQRIANGWCQDMSYDEETGSYCAGAALMDRTGDLYNILAGHIPYNYSSNLDHWENVRAVVSYNDSHGRTKEEVLAVFDAAIDELKAS